MLTYSTPLLLHYQTAAESVYPAAHSPNPIVIPACAMTGFVHHVEPPVIAPAHPHTGLATMTRARCPLITRVSHVASTLVSPAAPPLVALPATQLPTSRVRVTRASLHVHQQAK